MGGPLQVKVWRVPPAACLWHQLGRSACRPWDWNTIGSLGLQLVLSPWRSGGLASPQHRARQLLRVSFLLVLFSGEPEHAGDLPSPPFTPTFHCSTDSELPPTPVGLPCEGKFRRSVDHHSRRYYLWTQGLTSRPPPCRSSWLTWWSNLNLLDRGWQSTWKGLCFKLSLNLLVYTVVALHFLVSRQSFKNNFKWNVREVYRLREFTIQTAYSETQHLSPANVVLPWMKISMSLYITVRSKNNQIKDQNIFFLHWSKTRLSLIHRLCQ